MNDNETKQKIHQKGRSLVENAVQSRDEQSIWHVTYVVQPPIVVFLSLLHFLFFACFEALSARWFFR